MEKHGWTRTHIWSHIQCTPDIPRSISSQLLTIDIHCSPFRARHGCLPWDHSLAKFYLRIHCTVWGIVLYGTATHRECIVQGKTGWFWIHVHTFSKAGKVHMLGGTRWSGRSSTPDLEGLPDMADLPDLVIPEVDKTPCPARVTQWLSRPGALTREHSRFIAHLILIFVKISRFLSSCDKIPSNMDIPNDRYTSPLFISTNQYLYCLISACFTHFSFMNQVRSLPAVKWWMGGGTYHPKLVYWMAMALNFGDVRLTLSKGLTVLWLIMFEFLSETIYGRHWELT